MPDICDQNDPLLTVIDRLESYDDAFTDRAKSKRAW